MSFTDPDPLGFKEVTRRCVSLWFGSEDIFEEMCQSVLQKAVTSNLGPHLFPYSSSAWQTLESYLINQLNQPLPRHVSDFRNTGLKGTYGSKQGHLWRTWMVFFFKTKWNMDQDEADVDIMFVSQRVDSLEFPFSPRSPLVVEQLLNFLGFQHEIRWHTRKQTENLQNGHCCKRASLDVF